MRRQKIRRRTIRTALVASNLIVLALILTFVLTNPRSSTSTDQAAPVALSTAGAAANPLDQVSSADIALTVARVNSLPETTAISNQAQSQQADLALSASTNAIVSKPQVVATALKSSADITSYTTQTGDTVASVAAKFNVTSDSIRWSNDLNSDAVAPGTKLAIPPVNGIVYTVKAGDTPDSLASQYRASKDKIVAYNDAEIKGLSPGQQIIIPGATVVAPVSATQIASSISKAAPSAASFPWGSGPIYGSNGYDYGYCTWYVATQIPVPANWGNASTWAYYANLSGWHVSSTPTVGAIAQRGGGEGHVAIVTGVNPDGSVDIRDMNGSAGWGHVGNATRSAGVFQNYITP